MSQPIYKLVWNDLTTAGKITFGIPLIIGTYAAIILMLPICLVLFAGGTAIEYLEKRSKILGFKIETIFFK